MNSNPLQKAIDLLGMPKMEKALGIRYQSILGWLKRKRLPRTECTGETAYAKTIEVETGGEVTEIQLLDWSGFQSQYKNKTAA